MDRCAVTLYPLLSTYRPWLSPDLLNILLMSDRNAMLRVRSIQSYLYQRLKDAGMTQLSIFSDPQPGCFAEKYFNKSLEA